MKTITTFIELFLCLGSTTVSSLKIHVWNIQYLGCLKLKQFWFYHRFPCSAEVFAFWWLLPFQLFTPQPSYCAPFYSVWPLVHLLIYFPLNFPSPWFYFVSCIAMFSLVYLLNALPKWTRLIISLRLLWADIFCILDQH